MALIAVVQDCSTALSVRGANNYRNIASTVADASRETDLPIVFFNTTAGGLHPRVVEPFADSRVAVLQGARAAMLAIRRMIDYAGHRAASTPILPPPLAAQPEWVKRLASGAPFTERESKAFLAAHGMTVTRERAADSADAAVAAAADLGYPVVLKIESPDLPHKTEAGGVRLRLADEGAVRNAFDEIMASARRYKPEARLDGVLVQESVRGGVETIAGLSRQEPFGMGVVFGAGGVLVELVKDAAMEIAPFGVAEARALVARTRVAKLLDGYRGNAPSDIESLAGLLARLSQIGAAYSGYQAAARAGGYRPGARREGGLIRLSRVFPHPGSRLSLSRWSIPSGTSPRPSIFRKVSYTSVFDPALRRVSSSLNHTYTTSLTGFDANRKKRRYRSGMPFLARRQLPYSRPSVLPRRKPG